MNYNLQCLLASNDSQKGDSLNETDSSHDFHDDHNGDADCFNERNRCG
jgi:hypothetical protein